MLIHVIACGEVRLKDYLGEIRQAVEEDLNKASSYSAAMRVMKKYQFSCNQFPERERLHGNHSVICFKTVVTDGFLLKKHDRLLVTIDSTVDGGLGGFTLIVSKGGSGNI